MFLEMSLSDFDKMLDDVDILLQIKNNVCVRFTLLCSLNLTFMYIIFGHMFSTINVS